MTYAFTRIWITIAKSSYALYESAGICRTPKADRESNTAWQRHLLEASHTCLTPRGSALWGCESSKQPQAAPAASGWGAVFWLMKNSAHTCLAMASQPLNRSQKSLSYTLEFKWKLLHLNWRFYFSSSCLTLNCLSEKDWALVKSFPFSTIYSRRRSMF